MAVPLEELYEADIVAWAQDQAKALRRLADEHWNGPLDLLHLAEEIEDVGSEIVFGVLSQVERIILHLLKLEYAASPEPRRQWILSIDEGRGQAVRRMTKTIRHRTGSELPDLYRRARRAARLQLLDHDERQAAGALPQSCPYTLDQILDEAWYPACRHGHVDEV